MAEIKFDGDASKYKEGDPMLKLSQEKRAFIEEVAYYANKEYSERKAKGQDWVLPSVCIAQACLESGYGEHTTVNIFGIKGAGTVATTSEEYTPGTHTTIRDSFVSHGTIAEDVHTYYDLICGTGNYVGWDIYKKARNNEDPYDALKEIRAAGYATSSTYVQNTQAILRDYNLSQFDTGLFKIEYNESGYTAGVNTYEQAKKILTDLQVAVETAKQSLESACNNKPKVDYKTFIEIETLSQTIETAIDLLDRVQGIAEREKYIAEQYNEDGGGSLDQFQAVALMTGTLNFSFNNMEDFKQLVTDYKANGSNQVFSKWLESYINDKGISSSVVNMSKYQEAIKSTGAVSSNDYVTSKVQFAMAETNKDDTGAKESNTDTKNNNTSNNTSNNNNNYSGPSYSPSSSSSSNSSTQFRSSSSNESKEETKTESKVEDKKETTTYEKSDTVLKDEDKKEEETTTEEKTTEEKTDTTPEETKSNEVLDTTTPTPEAEVPKEETTVIQVPTNNNNNNNYSNDNNSTYNPIRETTTSIANNPTEPTEGVPVEETPLETVFETPTELERPNNNTSSITRIPSNNTTVPQSSSSKGSGALAIGLGLGAAAAAVAGGAYYMKTKEKEREDSEPTDEEYEIEDDYDLENDTSFTNTTSDVETEKYTARKEDNLKDDDYVSDDDDTELPTYHSPSGNKFN